VSENALRVGFQKKKKETFLIAFLKKVALGKL
jgi:hypothetical protein